MFKQRLTMIVGLMRIYWTVLPFMFMLLFFIAACNKKEPTDIDRKEYRNWTSYLGDKSRTHYSSLDQINTENVHDLGIAWTFSTDDAIEGRTEIQCNPIIIDGVLYCTTAQLKAFALQADTGKLLWVFDPFEEEPSSRGRNRGVAYWSDGTKDSRLFYVAGSKLYALNAKTGEPVGGFGEEGSIDFIKGLELDSLAFSKKEASSSVTSSSPGVIYNELLIQGSTVYGRAPGYIRAFNVKTGELEWVFRTIPQPGEYGHETWPTDAWKTVGNANSWAGMTLDEERGIVYVPTASPGDDFYGGDRTGRNLFGSSLLALDAASGDRIWHYQIVRHDIWDRDPPAPPNLVTIQKNNNLVDAVVQVTKTGHVFVFDRENGEPLFPIEEIKTPMSDLPGEVTSPTQPVPVKPAPFVRQEFREEDITMISPEAHEAVLKRYREIRTGHMWEPPSRKGTLIFPGTDGGAEWGGAAFDPETGVLYVNATVLPFIITMVEADTGEDQRKPMTAGQRLYTRNCASCHGVDLDGDPSLIDIKKKFSHREIESIIENGQGMMPSFGHLEQDESDAIINFLANPDTLEPAEMKTAKGSQTQAESPRFTHTGYNRFRGPEGYPAIDPPWGTLNAVDLNTGEYLWKIRLGEFEELKERGIPQTGTNNYGGPVVTAGGLLFIAATQDEKFRAFDKKTGELLWETTLPAAGYATPATFEVNGRQYIVIAAGGGKLGTKSGDTYVAFALPQ